LSGNVWKDTERVNEREREDLRRYHEEYSMDYLKSQFSVPSESPTLNEGHQTNETDTNNPGIGSNTHDVIFCCCEIQRMDLFCLPLSSHTLSKVKSRSSDLRNSRKLDNSSAISGYRFLNRPKKNPTIQQNCE
jgi:hypothetical protein